MQPIACTDHFISFVAACHMAATESFYHRRLVRAVAILGTSHGVDYSYNREYLLLSHILVSVDPRHRHSRLQLYYLRRSPSVSPSFHFTCRSTLIGNHPVLRLIAIVSSEGPFSSHSI